MEYEIKFSPSAERKFRKLPKNIQRQLSPHIDQLAITPRPKKMEKLKSQADLYRIRVGNYRIVYTIYDAELVILVVTLGHRKDVYRNI